MSPISRFLGAALATAALSAPAVAADRHAEAEAILAHLRSVVETQDLDFKDFDAGDGDAFYHVTHPGGRFPSCTTCHGQDPAGDGALPDGRTVLPLAPSANPDRPSDEADFFLQIKGCCNLTLGHDCSARQKGDVSTYLFAK